MAWLGAQAYRLVKCFVLFCERGLEEGKKESRLFLVLVFIYLFFCLFVRTTADSGKKQEKGGFVVNRRDDT